MAWWSVLYRTCLMKFRYIIENEIETYIKFQKVNSEQKLDHLPNISLSS